MQSPHRKHLGATSYARGMWAEALAAWWLRAKGYRIVAQRWRCSAGEIDIIVRRRGVLVAVEVKARPSATQGLEAISAHQQQRLLRALEVYATRHPQGWHSLRLDSMVVCPWRLPRHTPDAWRAS